MIPRGAALACVVALLTGCVYYNALYNAEHLFQEGEEDLAAGRDSAAMARYAQVVAKSAKGFRMDPDGEWADDALLLLGRAYLRMGDLRAGRAALRRAEALADDEQVRQGARLYLGASYVQAGDAETGIPLLNEAIQALRSGPVTAEGHLWRARALLTDGEQDAGWWDLDQAGLQSRTLRTAAALDRVVWGERYASLPRVREGFARLLTYSEAGQRVDSVATLVEGAARLWGPGVAETLLAGADTAGWRYDARGRVRLVRAALLRDAGDTTRARAEVTDVADGFGDAAVQARVELARWRLARANDLSDIRDVLPILLPAEDDAPAAALLTSVRTTLDLAERGLTEPLALFAAGEVARDELGAPALARGLFLAYADGAPDDPWTAKALLAALAVTTDEGSRAWLRGRLEGRADSPYVLAARGEPAPGLEPLEEELARRLQEMRTH